MKVKTVQELNDMDEDLRLFDEKDWDFLNVQDGESLEYFNDIRDIDFCKRGKTDLVKYCVIALLSCGILTASGVWLYNVTIGRHVLSDGDVSMTDDKIVTLQRVDGTKVESNDFIEISKVLSKYFNVLKGGSSYDSLNDLCLTSSTFCNTEKNFRESMQHSFDSNDSYSRALRCFGSYFNLSKINEILYKNDTYYVYANLNYPDNDALTEYFYTYANDMNKFFTTYEITEQNVVRYIIDLSETYALPTSSREICIEICKKGDKGFVLTDDSFITSNCTQSYNYAISQVIKILGSYKANNQYE